MVEDTRFRRTVTVNLKDGLHLRPISQIVETVRRFGSPVRICTYNASSERSASRYDPCHYRARRE